MKRLPLLTWLLIAAFGLSAQSYNTTLRSRVTFPFNLNDVWGYVAPDGTEYALVGSRGGVYVVSLADPDNAREVGFVPGQNSLWRDLKTYGEYAYVVADQGNEGLTIIDLTQLPDTVTFTRNNLAVPGNQPLQRAHNIYIDVPTGRAYIAGSRQNGGGMLIFDVATTPGQAEFLALAPRVYAHDVYVQGERMYASEINRGQLTIYDLKDLDNITELGSVVTPFAFTHNAWSDSTGNYVYTTDERGNAPVAAYDITDVSDPKLIDEFRPVGTVGSGLIPHNVHVIDDYLSISNYTAGLVVADASVPDNVVEIARYDTWEGDGGGFNGSWGAFPFFPSGLTVASDIQNGLYVIDVNYQRAARFRGVISDAGNGNPINDATIELTGAASLSTATDAEGNYKTGTADGGTFEVMITKEDYDTLRFTVELVNGVETVIDTVLTASFARYSLSGTVVSSLDNAGVADAEVVLIGESETYLAESDENGTLVLDFIFPGTYQVYAAKWGFRNVGFALEVTEDQPLNISLEPGYLDGFVLDQGWEIRNTVTTGAWERGVPNGTAFGSAPSNPGNDIDGDVGDFAYVTGNAPVDGAGDDDVDDGITELRSPVFDGTLLPNPILRYHYWFFNDGGNPPANDALTIRIDNGSQRVILAKYDNTSNGWTPDTIQLADFIELTDNMRLFVATGDDPNTGHIVEAGFDGFEIVSGSPSAVENVSLPGLEATVFPNPSSNEFRIDYQLPHTPRVAELAVHDALGRRVETRALAATDQETLWIGRDYAPGLYFLRLRLDGKVVYVTKLTKQ